MIPNVNVPIDSFIALFGLNECIHNVPKPFFNLADNSLSHKKENKSYVDLIFYWLKVVFMPMKVI